MLGTALAISIRICFRALDPLETPGSDLHSVFRYVQNDPLPWYSKWLAGICSSVGRHWLPVVREKVQGAAIQKKTAKTLKIKLQKGPEALVKMNKC